MPEFSHAQLQTATNMLKLLGSKTRLAILSLLARSKRTMCVNEIADEIKLSHSATCHQLSRLEREGVLLSKRDGQTVCYDFSENSVSEHIKSIINLLSKRK